MSDAESEEVSVVVERAGITVEKSFEPEDFPVPAIAFVIRSERDEPTDIRIVDSVPDDVPTQDIGFHPKYGADFWNVEDDQIVFEREFETGEEYTTVYGLRAKDTDDIDRFLTEPAIEGLDDAETVGDIIGEDAPEDESETDSEDDGIDETAADTGVSLDLDDPSESDTADEGDDAAADATGEAETTPDPRAEASTDDLEAAVAEAETETEAGADDEAADTDANGADEIDVAVDEVEGATAAEGNGTDEAAVEAVTPDDLAATLAAEIRAGEVDDEDLATLRDALGADLDDVEPGVPGSVEARIEKLQSDVSEVAAYTDALEAFLDESGSAEELLAVQDEVESMQGSIGNLEGSLESVETRVDSVEATAEGAAEDVAALESAVDGLSESLSAVEAEVAGLRDDVDALEDDLGEDLDDRVVELETQLDGMEDDIEDLEKLRQVFAGND
jgi:phage shock protein A